MIRIEHDGARRRFLTVVDGQECTLTYHPAAGGVLDYASTYVPPAARRRGIATALVREALDYARRDGYRVIPSCWFVRDYLGAHPEYADLVVNQESPNGAEDS